MVSYLNACSGNSAVECEIAICRYLEVPCSIHGHCFFWAFFIIFNNTCLTQLASFFYIYISALRSNRERERLNKVGNIKAIRLMPKRGLNRYISVLISVNYCICNHVTFIMFVETPNLEACEAICIRYSKVDV